MDFPGMAGPVAGETTSEARRRRGLNAVRRARWYAYVDDRCAECGQVRFHVSHEMDPEHSAEGPEYHADFAHHPFRETDLSKIHSADVLLGPARCVNCGRMVWYASTGGRTTRRWRDRDGREHACGGAEGRA
jgi:hypothetical protein